jgi:hypothetical protein
MKIKISESELENFIIETVTEEIFVVRRKIELLSKIIENFDELDCSKPMVQSYQRVYCQTLKNFNLSELIQAKDSLKEKFEDLVKKEFRKKGLTKK